MQTEAHVESSSSKPTPRYMQRAVVGASLVSLATLIVLLVYAALADPDGPPRIANSMREQLFTGAFGTAICSFPIALFVIRLRQWTTHKAKHPSVPLCLLAVASLIPFMFSVGILFLA